MDARATVGPPMQIACPHCRGQMEVADQGGSFACPHCQRAITVPPGGSASPAAPGKSRKISLPKFSFPRIQLPVRALSYVAGVVVVLALVVVAILIMRSSCTAATPKALEPELDSVFIDLHAVERAKRCEKIIEDKAEFEAGKPFELEKTDEAGTICREISRSKPSKRRLRCQKFADRIVGLMAKDTKVDTSGRKDKLVQTCLRDFNPAAIDCVLTAKSKESATLCQEVERGEQGDESEGEYGGFELAGTGDCAEMEKTLATKVSRYENTLALQVQLHCDAAGQPTLEPNDAVRLAARASVHEALPKVVRAVGENKIAANIGACYFQLKKQVLSDGATRQKLRCQTLSQEIDLISPDMVVKLTIFDEVLDRYELADEFEEHTAEDVVGWSAAVENETIPSYMQAFLLSQKERLCGAEHEPKMEERFEAAAAAARSCM